MLKATMEPAPSADQEGKPWDPFLLEELVEKLKVKQVPSRGQDGIVQSSISSVWGKFKPRSTMQK